MFIGADVNMPSNSPLIPLKRKTSFECILSYAGFSSQDQSILATHLEMNSLKEPLLEWNLSSQGKSSDVGILCLVDSRYSPGPNVPSVKTPMYSPCIPYSQTRALSLDLCHRYMSTLRNNGSAAQSNMSADRFPMVSRT